MKNTLIKCLLLLLNFPLFHFCFSALETTTPLTTSPQQKLEEFLKEEGYTTPLVVNERRCGLTPLQSAIEIIFKRDNEYYMWHEKWCDIVKLMLDAHSDVNAQDKHRCTILLQVVDDLADSGLDTYFANNAIFIDILDMLIKAGARFGDLTYTRNCKRVESLFLEAIELENPRVINMFIKAGANEAQNDQGETWLHKATVLEKPYLVKMLIKVGVNLEAQDKGGETPLHRAIMLEKPRVVNILIKARANIEQTNKYESTPLRLAVIYDKPRLVNILLKAKANVEAQDNDGNSILHLAGVSAKTCAKTKVIECLLNAASNLNVQSKSGRTPLHWAAMFDEKDLCEILLKKGADPKISAKFILEPHTSRKYRDRDHYGSGSFNSLVNSCGDEFNSEGSFSAMRSHYEGQSNVIEIIQKRGFTPLDFAILNNSIHAATSLIQANPDEDSRKFLEAVCDYYKAIHYKENQLAVLSEVFEKRLKQSIPNKELLQAIVAGKVNLVKKALDEGAYPDVRYDDAYTALHKAVEYNNVNCVSLLLRSHADTNVQDKGGWTSLHLAISNKQQAMTEFLIANKADVNIQNRLGETPLHIATELSDEKAIKVLLEAEADRTLKTKKGDTVFDIVARYKNPAIIRIVGERIKEGKYEDRREHKGDIPDGSDDEEDEENNIHAQLLRAVNLGTLESVTTLLQSGAKPTFSDEHSFTALHLAAEQNKVEILKLLLDAGASPTSQTKEDKSTALHLAVKEGHFECARLLLKKNASIQLDTLDSQEHSPLYKAVERKDIKMVQLLLKADLDPSTRKVELDFALKEKCVEIVKSFIENGYALNQNIITLFAQDFAQGHNKNQYLIKLAKNTDFWESIGEAAALDVASFLVKFQGVDINAKEESTGDTALHCALKADNIALVDFLLKQGAQVTDRNHQKVTPLSIVKNRRFKSRYPAMKGLIIEANSNQNGCCALGRFAKNIGDGLSSGLSEGAFRTIQKETGGVEGVEQAVRIFTSSATGGALDQIKKEAPFIAEEVTERTLGVIGQRLPQIATTTTEGVLGIVGEKLPLIATTTTGTVLGVVKEKLPQIADEVTDKVVKKAEEAVSRVTDSTFDKISERTPEIAKIAHDTTEGAASGGVKGAIVGAADGVVEVLAKKGTNKIKEKCLIQ